MEQPPKQGLKPGIRISGNRYAIGVLMEHPPKQGLKQDKKQDNDFEILVF